MKILLLSTILGIFLQANPGNEKIIEKSASIEKGKHLNLDFKFADEINITTWDKQEVYIKATVNINDNKDNDQFAFEEEKKVSGLIIRSEINNMEKYKDKELEMSLNFEVNIPNNITLELNTISGDIITKGFDQEMNINTISGFVDVTLPAGKKANLKASTISGEVFTNHELDQGKEEHVHQIVGQKVDATINGGGTNIDLKTISGNIYIRK